MMPVSTAFLVIMFPNQKKKYPFALAILAFLLLGHQYFVSKHSSNIIWLYRYLNDLLQFQWDILSRPFRGDPIYMEVFGSCFYWTVWYWLIGSLFIFSDITGKPGFVTKHKIQETRHGTRLSLGTVFRVAKNVLLNQTVITLPVLYCSYKLRKLRGIDESETVPPLHIAMIHLLGYALIEEIMFYYTHRLLHSRMFYSRIHKTHHEWTAPIGITSMYCHPVEHVAANVIPTVMGAILFGSHISTLVLWFLASAPFGIIIHCGYSIPFLPSPRAHDFHHINYKYNFAFLGLMDRWHGTSLIPDLPEKSEHYFAEVH